MGIGIQAAIQLLRVLRIGVPIAVLLGAAALYDIVPKSGTSAPGIWDGIALLGVMLWPLGGYVIVEGLLNWLQTRAAVSWPVFSGTVLSSEVGVSYSYAGPMYAPEVNYRYDVHGQHLENDDIQSVSVRYLSASAAKAIADKYPVGAKVKVRVDPRDVTRSVLELGDNAARRRVVIGLLTLAAPVLAGALLNWLNTLS
ncbi:MAG: DUF3592 domain-containing protein [Rhizobiales bacterium]|nr:DUF3592 domain-containing protein [Hyphomicrobiales bacterium]